MGLIKFAIYFILGNIFLTAIEKHSHRVKDIYLIGDLYGNKLEIYIKQNTCTMVVIFMSLLAFIL
jgi:hypothetical protein